MKNKQLELYTKALLAEVEFRAKHKKLFEELTQIRLDIANTETELKKEVKNNVKTNISNDFVKVTYSQAFKKYYDFATIMEMTTPKQKKELENANAIVRTLDKKAFEELVEKGLIPIEVKQEAFREDEQTPRVSIKEQKPE